MSATVPTWGYRQGESRIFELPHGGALPAGWYDSPAKIPAGGSGKGGGPAAAVSHPAPPAPPPPPSIEEQERAEYGRALAENAALKARLAELEAQLAGAVPLPLPQVAGLPQPPGSEPGLREILQNADPTPPPPSLPEDIEALRERARALGIEVDTRWGAKRLQREIAYKDDEVAERGRQ